MGSRWHGTSRPATVGAAVGTAILAAASAVLVASATGALQPRYADAAIAHVHTTTIALNRARVAAAVVALEPSRTGPRTTLTHLPLTGVSDGTRGVAIRLNGRPATADPKPSPVLAS